MASWNTIKLSEIKPDRFDAEYFRKDCQKNIDILESTGPTTNLGRIFNYINRGSQPSYSENGTLKVLRSVNVGFMNFNETRQEYVTEAFFENSNRGKVQKDDVLITSTGVGTLGRTSIWYENEKAYCDGHITILRNSVIDPYLITTFLNTKYGLKQFDQNYRGSSGQIEIYPYDISKFVIPECILQYQNEVGNYLRESFDLKQQSQNFYKEATKLLNEELDLDEINDENNKFSNKYLSSFEEVVNNHRLDSEYYTPKTKAILNKVQSMRHTVISNNFDITNGFPWNSKKFLEDNSGEPVIRIRDIKPTYIDKNKLTSLEKSYANTISFNKAQKGDIVIGMDGVKYFYASILEEECLVNQRVCHIVPKANSEISSEYTTFIVNSIIGQSQLLRDMTIASTVGHITNKNVAKLKIPVVSNEFHNIITSLIRKSIDADKKSKQLLEQAKQRVEELIENAAGVTLHNKKMEHNSLKALFNQAIENYDVIKLDKVQKQIKSTEPMLTKFVLINGDLRDSKVNCELVNIRNTIEAAKTITKSVWASLGIGQTTYGAVENIESITNIFPDLEKGTNLLEILNNLPNFALGAFSLSLLGYSLHQSRKIKIEDKHVIAIFIVLKDTYVGYSTKKLILKEELKGKADQLLKDNGRTGMNDLEFDDAIKKMKEEYKCLIEQNGAYYLLDEVEGY